jgi:predicted metal-dependent RNase
LNGILDGNDIQGYISDKDDNTQLSQRTHKISDSEDKDNGTQAEDQRITLEPKGMPTFSC